MGAIAERALTAKIAKNREKQITAENAEHAEKAIRSPRIHADERGSRNIKSASEPSRLPEQHEFFSYSACSAVKWGPLG
jgi:hypothetical protein